MALKVVVLGANLPAYALFNQLKPAVEQGVIELTFVHPHNYCFLAPLVVKMVTAQIGPHQLLEAARRLFTPAQFYVGQIIDVNQTNQEVIFVQPVNGQVKKIGYDHLIIEAEPITEVACYVGGMEHGYTLFNYETALQLRNQMIALMELADGFSSLSDIKPFMRWVVIGATKTGVELAAELALYQKQLQKDLFSAIPSDQLEVVLIEIKEEFLADVQEKLTPAEFNDLQQQLKNHLAQVGVKHIQTQGIEKITDQAVILEGGQRLESKLPILTCPTTFATHQIKGLEIINGYLTLNRHLQVKNQPYLWGIGSQIRGENNFFSDFNLPINSSKLVADNLLRYQKGEKLAKYEATSAGGVISFGGELIVQKKDASTPLGRASVWQWYRSVLKQLPRFDRKFRLLIDYFIRRLIGYDLVAMDIRQESDYQLHYLFVTTGTIIGRVGQYCPYCYLILEGQIKQGEASPTVLGPGQFLRGPQTAGYILPEQWQALEPSRLVRIPLAQLSEIQQIMGGLAQITQEGQYA